MLCAPRPVAASGLEKTAYSSPEAARTAPGRRSSGSGQMPRAAFRFSRKGPRADRRGVSVGERQARATQRIAQSSISLSCMETSQNACPSWLPASASHRLQNWPRRPSSMNSTSGGFPHAKFSHLSAGAEPRRGAPRGIVGSSILPPCHLYSPPHPAIGLENLSFSSQLRVSIFDSSHGYHHTRNHARRALSGTAFAPLNQRHAPLTDSCARPLSTRLALMP